VTGSVEPASPTETDGTVRLSPLQRRIWASQRIHPDTPLANMGDPVRISGPLDADRLSASFDAVVRRSEVLRMVVIDAGSARLLAEPPARTEVFDVEASDRDAWMAERIATPIDATRCVYDSVVLRHADDDWTWWLCIHHVAVDASAASLVLRATAAAYDHQGDPADADLSAIIDPSFFGWVDSIVEPDVAPALSASEPISVGFPLDPPRTASERLPLRFEAGEVELVDRALAGPMRAISRDLSLVALTALGMARLVHRLDGRSTVVVGVPLHHRMHKTDRRRLGPMMELAPLVVEIDPGATGAESFAAVTRSLVDLLRTPPGASSGSTFDTVVNVFGAGAPSFGGAPATRSWVRSDHDDPSQRLAVQVRVTPAGAAEWLLDLDPGVAPDDVQDEVGEWLRAEIVGLVRDPDAPMTTIGLAGPRALTALGPVMPQPSPAELTAPVHAQIITALTADPARVAIEHGDTSYTAGDVEDLSRCVAVRLQALGVELGDAVGVQMDRSADVMIVVLGVLRAGGAFVFLDPDDPLSRHEQMMADARVRTVVRDLADLLVDTDAVDDVDVVLPAVTLDDPAYVLFTSGSTGLPKGVPVSHRGLADYLRFAVDAYVLDGDPPVAALHSKLRFDLTITSLFLGLLTGGTTIVFDGEPLEALRGVASDDRVTFLKATPTQLDLYSRFVDGRSSVDTLVVGGEAFRRSTAEAARSACAPDVRIFNEYGPTEAVVGCMIHEYDPDVDVDVDVPIGRACDGSQLVVLDHVGQLAPPGAWGELVVRRPGQPSAYVGDPAGAANDRFIELAHVDGLDQLAPDGTTGTWYRTGDRARIVRPGVAVYGGRSDDQLKVNGIRLEPGEVEAALAVHPAVSTAVVRIEPDGGGLIAWWQPASDGVEATPDELRAFAVDRLPRHAVPGAFVRVREFPLAASAKVDVARLPQPSPADRPAAAGEEAATATEDLVASAWRTVLGTSAAPSVTADLRDLGATSLGLLEAIAIVEDELSVELPIAEAVAARTVRALATVVDGALADGDRVRYPAADLVEPSPDLPPPLSPAEEALLFEHRADPSDIRYHGGRVFVIDAPIDPPRLASAVRDVVAHHPALRVAYDAERTVLDVARALDLETLAPMSETAFREVVDTARQQPFDLDRGPLVRARIAPLDDGRAALFIGKHHINGDAGTFEVIWRHLAARLQGEDLPDAPVSYAAHMVAQRRRHADVDDAGRRFWLERLNVWGEPRPPAFVATAGEGDGYLRVEADVTGAQLAASGRSAFELGLASLAATLARVVGDDRADFAAAVSTRDLASAREVVGNYLNTVPVSIAVPEGSTWSTLLDAAASWTREALAHRTVPFATIVRDARERGAPVPTGSILLVADRAEQVELEGTEVEQDAVLSGRAVTDLSFFIRERGAEQPVELAVEYRGSAVPADVAERLLDRFAASLREAVIDPSGSAEVSLAAAAELNGLPLVEQPTVLDRWLDVTAVDPGADAVVDAAGERLSHGALRDRAGQIASALESAVGGASPRRVGVSVERSVDLVAAMLAGQLVGAAVVPIDPTLPAARRALVAEAAQPDVVLVGTAELVPGGGDWSWVALDRLGEGSSELRDSAHEVGGDAYVIFTSGSTGTPRGVAVTHRNLAASTAARSQWFDRDPERFLVTSSFGFDSSAVGLWWTLATGGTIVLPSDDDVHDVDALAELIKRERATHVLMVPSLYEALLARAGDLLIGLRTVIVAGEACTTPLAVEHHRVLPGVELINEYGPTEATVWSTVHRIGPHDHPVPIGRPIPGMIARVAGPTGRPVASGAVGELWVSGPGVTAGYVDDAEATQHRFIERDGARWYRTGDAVAERDGDLLFVGRVDDQLNVGGVRVEPTEIEEALRSIDGIDDAVAVAAGRPTRLVAHVVTSGAIGEFDDATIRRLLSERLPAGAVPSRVVAHDYLPRTANGKLDRVAAVALAVGRAHLPRDGDGHPRYDEPLASVIEAWESVFDQQIVADTDFFDVGGDSLSAVVLVTELAARLGHDVPIAAVVTGRTPAGMVHQLVGDDSHEGEGPLQVVRFAPGGDAGPVVVMTPAWDDVFGYQLLGRAMPDGVPVVGFGLTDVRAVTSVDGFVDLVIDRLDTDGLSSRPLVIVGWSIGGVAAMELAARLDAAGRDVLAVGLVDTFFPGEEEHIWSNRWWKYRSLLTLRALPEWRKEVGKAVGRRFGRLAKKMKRRLTHPRMRSVRGVPDTENVDAQGTVKVKATVERPPTPVAMIGSIPADAFTHEPSPVGVPVVFFAASGTNPERTHRRWSTVASDLSVISVQGRHRGFESVMGADRVGRLVVGLQPYLRR